MTRWTAADAAAWLTPPAEADDKYARGVLGVATGSVAYPGAAVLGVEAALHTGVGMIRYVGPEEVGRLVLSQRPEAVLGAGRVNAWVVGSGMVAPAPHHDGGLRAPGSDDRRGRGPDDDARRVDEALASRAPVVLDAGAIARASEAVGPVIITPHAGELATLLDVPRDSVAADPAGHAHQASAACGAVVLLKGATTIVARAERETRHEGATIEVREATPWLATAGAGDALAGILGALVATRAARHGGIAADDLVALGATAAFIHGRAARLAARIVEQDGPHERRGARAGGHGGGPFTILDLCAAVPDVVRDLLAP